MKHLLLTILILLPVLTAFDCKGVKGSDASIFSKLVILDKNSKGTTPEGVRVGAFKSVPASVKTAIDKGLTTTFDAAAKEYPGKVFRTHADYFAGVFWDSDKCPSAFTVGPSIAVGGNPYDQSEFDLDDRLGWTELCVAGAFQYVNSRPGVFVVYDPKNPSMTEIGAQYEAEHAVLVELDPWRFAATQYHSGGPDGTGHPIFPGVPSPESQGQAGLAIRVIDDAKGLSPHVVVSVDANGVITANAPVAKNASREAEAAIWKNGERALIRLVKPPKK